MYQPADAQELFGRLPADHVFGDLKTSIELACLVVEISNKNPSKEKETAMCLLQQLSANFNELRSRIRGEVGRAELRKRLQAVADGAQQIRAELDEPAVLSRLIAEKRAEYGYCGTLRVKARLRLLEELAYLANSAAEKVPQGKDRKRHVTDGFSARELCAFMVRRLWHAARGEWPGSQNDQVWAICERLWKAAGGMGSPRNGETPSRWRRALKRVEAPLPPAHRGAALMRGGDGRVGIVKVLGRQSEGSTKKA